MSLYFFHYSDGIVVRDDTGTDLRDIEAARVEAVKLAGQMLVDGAAGFWSHEEWQLRVADEDDLTLFTLEVVGTAAPAVSC